MSKEKTKQGAKEVMDELRTVMEKEGKRLSAERKTKPVRKCGVRKSRKERNCEDRIALYITKKYRNRDTVQDMEEALYESRRLLSWNCKGRY